MKAAFDLALFDVIHVLLVHFGAERRRNDRLRFAAREQSRAVNSRKPSDFARDRADLRELTAVWTPLVAEHVLAEDLFLELAKSLSGRTRVHPDRPPDSFRRLLSSERRARRKPRSYPSGRIESSTELVRPRLFDIGDDVLVDGRDVKFAFRDIESFAEFFLPQAEALDLLMSKHQGLDHDLFFDLVGFAFDHADRFFGTGNDKVEVRFAAFVVCRVDDVFAVDQTDANSGDRGCETGCQKDKGHMTHP